MIGRMHAYAQLMRIDRPIGTLLLLWPTLWGLWIASAGWPNGRILTVFILGVCVMRAAGCVINDFADQKIDRYVKRTDRRPFARGAVRSVEALMLAAALLLLAFFLVLQLNRQTIALSFVGLLLAAIYPFLKRVTHLPQLWLGAAFAWGIPMAFMAQQNHVPWVGWWLFLTTLLWVVAYDGMYAMVDRDDDLKIGVKSIAILLGNWDVRVLSGLQWLVLLSLFLIGLTLDYNLWFYAALLLASALVVYQVKLIQSRERDACFRAFINNNWFGLVIFLGILLQRIS